MHSPWRRSLHGLVAPGPRVCCLIYSIPSRLERGRERLAATTAFVRTL